MVCAMIFCSSAFLAESPVLQLLLVFVSLFVVAFVAGLILRPCLTVSLRPPAFAECDRSVELPVWIRNDSAHAAFDVALELTTFPDGWKPRPQRCPIRNLASGEATVAKVVLRPTRRGLVSWPKLEIVTNFPFNLFRFWRAQSVSGRLVVLPRFRKLAHFQVSESASRYGGTQLLESISAGEMREYAGSREYQPGVAVRKWDYASWARLAKPVVREFTDQSKPAGAVVVDMCGTMAHPTENAREACLSLAAAIGDALASHGYPLSWFAVGIDVANIREQPTHRQLSALMEALALAEECKEDGLSRLTNELAKRSCQSDMVYFVTPTWDGNRDNFRRLLANPGCTVRTLFVQEDYAEVTEGLPTDVQVLTTHQINSGAVQLR